MSMCRPAAAVLMAVALTAGADDSKPRPSSNALTISQAGNLPKLLPAVQITMPNFGMVPGETRAIHATMKSGENPVPGKKLWFFVSGNQIGSDVTDGTGKATFNWKLPNMAQGNYDVTVKFTGDATHRAGEAASKLLVVKGITETKVEFTTVANEGGSSPALLIFIIHVTRKSDGQKILDQRVDVKVNGAVYHNATGQSPKTESPNVPPAARPLKVDAQYNGDAYSQASFGTATHQ
ncbi:MAG: Ig-like domain-containing protein [Thermoanaerobaculia bacterium]|nr:Ig-like domain-containing protein [Thermoanaerobaculia bacterium]